MFGSRYFGPRYWGARYFGHAGQSVPGRYLGERYWGPRYFGNRYWGTGDSSPDVTLSLVGQALASGAGSVGWNAQTPLVGVAILGAAGTLNLTLRPTDMVGQAMASGIGTLSLPSSGDKSVALSGAEASSQGGLVGYHQTLTGLASGVAAGVVVSFEEVALTGVAVTCSAGTCVGNIEADDVFIQSGQGVITQLASTVALTGAEVSCVAGNVITDTFREEALTGQASDASAGVAAPSVECGLTGQQIAAAQQNVGAPGGATLTGAVIVGATGVLFTEEDRTQALTGASTTAEAGIVAPRTLAFFPGLEITADLTNIGDQTVALGGIAVASEFGALMARLTQDTPSGGWAEDYIRKHRKRKKKEEEEKVVAVVAKPVAKPVDPTPRRVKQAPPPPALDLDAAIEKAKAAKAAKDAKAEEAKRAKRRKEAEKLLLLM